ncbi:MAG: hypothetical protein JJ975_03660 [Bacteroidia bacterium]|nr:hypothetical protein [Bacteroidia bacterium]
MKFRFIPIFIIVLAFGLLDASGQNKRRPYEFMIGQPPTYPPLADWLMKLDSGQIDESFNSALNEYEIRSYEEGVALLFNHNFMLKEIQFYDSGHLYSRFSDTMPADVHFNLNIKDFENYGNLSYKVDTFNKFVYHRSSYNLRLKLYFKDKHVELVKITGKDSFLGARDSLIRTQWGMRIIPDGNCVFGNCFKGEGMMQWASSLTYRGNWESGTPNGDGSFSDTTGLLYKGGFKLGFLWGDAELHVPKQYVYNGNFLFGKKVGHGEITYANGTRYEGNWINDLMNGDGHFWYSDSYHYKGQFFNNQFQGIGILYSPEGYVEGSFKDNKPHGYCKQVVTRSHTTLSGVWVEGKKEGEFQLYNPVSGTTTLQFKNDQQVQ